MPPGSSPCSKPANPKRTDRAWLGGPAREPGRNSYAGFSPASDSAVATARSAAGTGHRNPEVYRAGRPRSVDPTVPRTAGMTRPIPREVLKMATLGLIQAKITLAYSWDFF